MARVIVFGIVLGIAIGEFAVIQQWNNVEFGIFLLLLGMIGHLIFAMAGMLDDYEGEK